MRIEGSGALVAGGASGLGEATARLLRARGAEVVIADLNEDKGSALDVVGIALVVTASAGATLGTHGPAPIDA